MVEHCTPDGRLPDGDKGADHIRYIFYKVRGRGVLPKGGDIDQSSSLLMSRWASTTEPLLLFPALMLLDDATPIDPALMACVSMAIVLPLPADLVPFTALDFLSHYLHRTLSGLFWAAIS